MELNLATDRQKGEKKERKEKKKNVTSLPY
jgi:hypothetical protein